MVVTAAGLVAIENIQPGDVVLAANEETGEYAYKEVVRTFVNTTEEITHVTISNGEGVQEVIDSTPQHPFYVEGKGWVEASALHAGMTIWFANGTKGTVEDISKEGLEEPVTVYNFEVADFHTYFVGESGVLVHNTCPDIEDLADSIPSADRVGTALEKDDVYHRAPSYLSSDQLAQGSVFSIVGKDGANYTLLQVEGGVNGTDGIFEYIVNAAGEVTHQRFKAGGIINGIPN